MNVRLVKDQKIRISNSQDIFAIMRQILMRENRIGRDKEHFWVVGLSSSNRILFIELISLGTVSRCLVNPMEVFSFALQRRAVKLILVHNHPSGDLRPSMQDMDITERLLQNSLFLQTPVIDHLVISETAYYSFAESGMLDLLRESKRYVTPHQQEEERLRQEGEKKKSIEIATVLKRQHVEIPIIAEASGLPEKEIEKL